jgi:DNA polymerase III delta prime subunit
MSDNAVATPMDEDVPTDKRDKSQLPWVEKYRPQKLEDLVAHEDIINILTNLIDSENLPHLLLYGPPGTGKTSTIVAAAKRMYGGSKAYSCMTLELNASDARGIDVSGPIIAPFPYLLLFIIKSNNIFIFRLFFLGRTK